MADTERDRAQEDRIDPRDSAEEGVGREDRIYEKRFSAAEDRTREAVWPVLCRDFFQRYIDARDVVVDLGAGDGLFIRNIRAAHRIAVDISEHANALSNDGIEVHIAPATRFASSLSGPVDAIFMSNFLEHLPNKGTVLDVFEECARALKPGGKILILQPNIRLVGPRYWDYIDHHIALTERSICEALEVSGFDVSELITRFLPYTAKSTVGRAAGGGRRSAALVKWYLRLRPLWRIFGKQTFVVAKHRGE
jgi:SAM-dependent methyltransferase